MKRVGIFSLSKPHRSNRLTAKSAIWCETYFPWWILFICTAWHRFRKFLPTEGVQNVKSFRDHIVFFQRLLTLEDKTGGLRGCRDPMVSCAQLHKNPTADRIRAQRCICMLRTKACTIASSPIYKSTRLQFFWVRIEIKISGQHTTWSRWCHTLPPHQHTHKHTHKLAFQAHSEGAGIEKAP